MTGTARPGTAWASGDVLIYDADCAFCQRCLTWGRRHLSRLPTAIGYQTADLDAAGVTVDQAQRSIWLARTGAAPVPGAAAVAAILRAQPGLAWRLGGRLAQTPPLDRLAAAAYAWIARNRHRLPGGSPGCAVGAAPPPPPGESTRTSPPR